MSFALVDDAVLATEPAISAKFGAAEHRTLKRCVLVIFADVPVEFSLRAESLIGVDETCIMEADYEIFLAYVGTCLHLMDSSKVLREVVFTREFFIAAWALVTFQG